MMTMTIPDLFDRLGGLKRLPDLLGVSQQAVSNMKSRNTIPPKHWLTLVKAAQEAGLEGVTFEALSELNAQPEPAHGHGSATGDAA